MPIYTISSFFLSLSLGQISFRDFFFPSLFPLVLARYNYNRETIDLLCKFAALVSALLLRLVLIYSDNANSPQEKRKTRQDVLTFIVVVVTIVANAVILGCARLVALRAEFHWTRIGGFGRASRYLNAAIRAREEILSAPDKFSALISRNSGDFTRARDLPVALLRQIPR